LKRLKKLVDAFKIGSGPLRTRGGNNKNKQNIHASSDDEHSPSDFEKNILFSAVNNSYVKPSTINGKRLRLSQGLLDNSQHFVFFDRNQPQDAHDKRMMFLNLSTEQKTEIIRLSSEEAKLGQKKKKSTVMTKNRKKLK
jgi:hypothetical protein